MATRRWGAAAALVTALAAAALAAGGAHADAGHTTSPPPTATVPARADTDVVVLGDDVGALGRVLLGVFALFDIGYIVAVGVILLRGDASALFVLHPALLLRAIEPCSGDASSRKVRVAPYLFVPFFDDASPVTQLAACATATLGCLFWHAAAVALFGKLFGVPSSRAAASLRFPAMSAAVGTILFGGVALLTGEVMNSREQVGDGTAAESAAALLGATAVVAVVAVVAVALSIVRSRVFFMPMRLLCDADCATVFSNVPRAVRPIITPVGRWFVTEEFVAVAAAQLAAKQAEQAAHADAPPPPPAVVMAATTAARVDYCRPGTLASFGPLFEGAAGAARLPVLMMQLARTLLLTAIVVAAPCAAASIGAFVVGLASAATTAVLRPHRIPAVNALGAAIDALLAFAMLTGVTHGAAVVVPLCVGLAGLLGTAMGLLVAFMGIVEERRFTALHHDAALHCHLMEAAADRECGAVMQRLLRAAGARKGEEGETALSVLEVPQRAPTSPGSHRRGGRGGSEDGGEDVGDDHEDEYDDDGANDPSHLTVSRKRVVVNPVVEIVESVDVRAPVIRVAAPPGVIPHTGGAAEGGMTFQQLMHLQAMELWRRAVASAGAADDDVDAASVVAQDGDRQGALPAAHGHTLLERLMARRAMRDAEAHLPALNEGTGDLDELASPLLPREHRSLNERGGRSAAYEVSVEPSGRRSDSNQRRRRQKRRGRRQAGLGGGGDDDDANGDEVEERRALNRWLRRLDDGEAGDSSVELTHYGRVMERHPMMSF